MTCIELRIWALFLSEVEWHPSNGRDLLLKWIYLKRFRLLISTVDLDSEWGETVSDYMVEHLLGLLGWGDFDLGFSTYLPC